MLFRTPLFLPLTLSFALLGTPLAFSADDELTELAGCREELVFTALRPMIEKLLVSLRDTRKQVVGLKVDKAGDVAAAMAAHFTKLKNSYAQTSLAQNTVRIVISEALKARKSTRKERMDELVHDLGNTLAPVVNGITILELQAPTLATMKQIIPMIDKWLEKAEELVEKRLLEVMDQVKFSPAEELVNVYDIFTTIAALYKTSSIPVNVAVKKSELNILANDLDIFTAISNLVKNAQEAIQMHREGKGEIWVKAYVENGYVIIEVKDNGPGMPEEAQKRMLNRNASDKGAGRGVGLSSVQRVVFDHNGEFNFESATEGRNRGTTFHLRFPEPVNPKPKK